MKEERLNGRVSKRPPKGFIQPSVDLVSETQAGASLPEDVRAKAANKHKFPETYNQCFRALESDTSDLLEKNKRSFKLMIRPPYIQEFMNRSRDSAVVALVRDGGNRITSLFVCPGVMKDSLK